MKSPEGLHFKTSVMILLMVIFGPLGDILLGKGMKKIPAMASWMPGDVFRFFFRRVHLADSVARHRLAPHFFRRVHGRALLG